MEHEVSVSEPSVLKREKSSVRFASVLEERDDSKPNALQKRDGSFANRSAKPRLKAEDALDKSSLSKRHSRRRKFWKRLMMRSNPRYWLHVLNKKLPIILPDSSFRYRWDLNMLILVVYVCFMIPYEIGFGFYPLPEVPWMVQLPPNNGTSLPPLPPLGNVTPNPSIDYVVGCLKVLDWVIDGFFWVDLLLNFRSAYVDRTASLVRDGGTIARTYLRTWFTVDLLACVPFDSIILSALPNVSSQTLNGVMLLRIIRLLRLARLLRIIERMKKGAWMRLAKLIFFILLLVHWITCLWFYMFRMLRLTVTWDWTFYNYVNENSTMATYFFSAYLNTYVLMIGNDVLPANSVERAFCSVVLAIGACFYAIILGNISLLVTNLAPTAARHRLKQDIVNNTVRYLGLPSSVVNRVGEHFDYLLARNHPGSDGMQMLNTSLPSSMHRDISAHMYSNLVRSVPLFSDVEDAFIRHLVTRLRLQVYLAGEQIFKQGDAGHEMYFVTKGHLAILNGKKELLKIESKGGFFGELGLLATALRTATVVSLCDCDLALLSANDLVGVMNTFPDSAKTIRQKAMRRLGELTAAGSVSTPAGSMPEQASPNPLTKAAVPFQPLEVPQAAAAPLSQPLGFNNSASFKRSSSLNIRDHKVPPSSQTPPALAKAPSFMRQGSLARQVSGSLARQVSGSLARQASGSLARQISGSLAIRPSPNLSPSGFREPLKSRQDSSSLEGKRASDNEDLWGNNSFSEDDTLKLLEEVHESVADLTGRLTLIHGSINEVNSRLAKIESHSAGEEEVGEEAVDTTAGDSRGLEFDM